MAERYDVIIIGTGAGGGTLAHTLAPSGKRILLLERGDFLPREMDNWDPGKVFIDGKYISTDTWYDADGNFVELVEVVSQTDWLECRPVASLKLLVFGSQCPGFGEVVSRN